MERKSLSFSKGVNDALAARNISDEQRRALLARLSYVVELCDKLEASSTSARAPHVVGDIELDAWVNLGAPEDGAEREISSWLIHTTWSSECENFRPSVFLEPRLRERLENSSSVGAFMTLDEWMSAQSVSLRLAASGAMGAVDICSLVAHVMAMNILLLDLLANVNRVRISSNAS